MPSTTAPAALAIAPLPAVDVELPAAPGIELAKLPPTLRSALAPLDIDGSGTLSASEIGAAVASHVASLAEAKAQAARLARLLTLIVLVFLLACGSMAAVVYVVIGARVSSQPGTSVYTAAGVVPLLATSGAPVHVRSTIAVAPVTVTASSADESLAKISAIALSPADGSSAASLTFKVNGWARVSPSLVVFFTQVQAFPYVSLDSAGSYTPVTATGYFNSSTPDGAIASAVANALSVTLPGGRRLVKKSSSAQVVADL
jgi:hypothetical protein